jgi:hypothetical protein
MTGILTIVVGGFSDRIWQRGLVAGEQRLILAIATS